MCEREGRNEGEEEDEYMKEVQTEREREVLDGERSQGEALSAPTHSQNKREKENTNTRTSLPLHSNRIVLQQNSELFFT